jgi:hypothetical protein
MVRLSRPLKGFALAGVLAYGCLPGLAHAKWIKATVVGTVTGTVSADNLAAPTAGPPPTLGSAITLNFYIQNYSGTAASGGNPNYWEQLTAKPNYSQLFGYGTGTNSTGLVGTFNASSTPGGGGNLIESQDDGTEFLIRVSGTPSSGLSITRSGVSTNVSNIALGGNLDLFSSSFPGSADVVDFLSASLGSASLGTYACSATTNPYNCTGQIQPNTESPITFSWGSITFEQVEAVPGPLPLAGALAGLSWSRKIRNRIKGK